MILNEVASGFERARPHLTNRSLHLVLMPTEACNCRCVYCYEDFRLGQMPPRVVRGVRSWLTARAPTLDSLHLSWFGGEPLLARRIIEEVSEHAQSLAARLPGLHYEASITTNAWLLSLPVFERLLDLRVAHFQISFDGPREHHDRKRVLAGGGPTFDRIWSNVTALREVARPFRVMIRLHADQENLAVLPEFLDLAEEAFRGDDRFQLFIRELSRLGGPNDDRLRILEGRDGEAAIQRLRDEARRRGLMPYAPESAVCYAAKANSFVVRADGRLGKCTVALDHPNNQVGRLLEDGTVELSPPRMTAWMRGLWSGDAKELACPMEGLADGSPAAVPIAFSTATRKNSRTSAPSSIAGVSNVR